MTREFRLLVRDAINRSRKLHNSVAEPYSDFEVRISAKASLKKGLFKNYVDKREWVVKGLFNFVPTCIEDGDFLLPHEIDS